MLRKKLVTFLIVLSLVSSTFYLPVFTPRAQAIFGFGDLVIDIKALATRIADGIAMSLAQRLVDDMVRSTVEWANTGFEGNPAFATNPKQFFADIADGVAGEYIAGTDLAYLCSPFQTQIRLALRNSYTRANRFQCTLTQVVGNIDAFYDDFNEGGWDGWFSMTQNSYNNPYGAYLDAQIELDSRIARELGLKNQQLDWADGFLSYEKCDETDPSYIAPRIVAGVNIPESCRPSAKRIVTPGTTIKSQIDNILPSGLNRLIQVQHVEQLIGAFANGLLNRFVFGPRGLFSPNHRDTFSDSTPPPAIVEPDLCDLAKTVADEGTLDEDCNPIVPGQGSTPSQTNPNASNLPTTLTLETQQQLDRYDELLVIRDSRPGGNWTSADFSAGLPGEFASLLNPLGLAYNAGLICTLNNRFVPIGTSGGSCLTPPN
jgi:hypothetical protein